MIFIYKKYSILIFIFHIFKIKNDTILTIIELFLF
jgi:hypothetical protein